MVPGDVVLRQVYVLEQFRGKGVATAMIHAHAARVSRHSCAIAGRARNGIGHGRRFWQCTRREERGVLFAPL